MKKIIEYLIGFALATPIMVSIIILNAFYTVIFSVMVFDVLKIYVSSQIGVVIPFAVILGVFVSIRLFILSLNEPNKEERPFGEIVKEFSIKFSIQLITWMLFTQFSFLFVK